MPINHSQINIISAKVKCNMAPNWITFLIEHSHLSSQCVIDTIDAICLTFLVPKHNVHSFKRGATFHHNISIWLINDLRLSHSNHMTHSALSSIAAQSACNCVFATSQMTIICWISLHSIFVIAATKDTISIRFAPSIWAKPISCCTSINQPKHRTRRHNRCCAYGLVVVSNVYVRSIIDVDRGGFVWVCCDYMDAMRWWAITKKTATEIIPNSVYCSSALLHTQNARPLRHRAFQLR